MRPCTDTSEHKALDFFVIVEHFLLNQILQSPHKGLFASMIDGAEEVGKEIEALGHEIERLGTKISQR